MSVDHVLKCWPEYYDAVERGEKPFDVRPDDRGFQKGDTVRLQRCVKRAPGDYAVDYDSQGKVKKEMSFEITYVLTGGQFGIEPGYVVLGLKARS